MKRFVIFIGILTAAQWGSGYGYQGRAVRESFLRERLIQACGQLPAHEEALALEVQRECGVECNILYLQAAQGTWGVSGVAEDVIYIRLLSGKRRFIQLFSLYHEMGHIIHEDLKYSNYATETAVIARLQEAAFKKDIQRINLYLEMGKKALSKTTLLGSVIMPRLQKSNSFWVPPARQDAIQAMTVHRVIEQRADLFAFEQLHRKGDMGTLCGMLYTFGISGYDNVIGSNDVHPADLERALYLVGFLVSKGINMEKVMRDFEKTMARQCKGKHSILTHIKKHYRKF